MATVKTIVIAGYLRFQVTQNQFWGLCDINEWWKRHRSDTVTRFGCNFVCHVICLPISPKGKPRTNFLTVVTYSDQSNSKLYSQKNNYVPNPPVELAHWLVSTIWLRSFDGWMDIVNFTLVVPELVIPQHKIGGRAPKPVGWISFSNWWPKRWTAISEQLNNLALERIRVESVGSGNTNNFGEKMTINIK